MIRVLKKALQWFFTRIALLRVGSYKTVPFCGGLTLLSSNTHLGVNTNFNGMKVRGRGILTIGDNFHSGSGCEIITQNHNYNGNKIPYDETYVVKNVRIHNNVWLGNRVIILPGVNIGEGAIIQAGSVIVKDIPPLSIAGGAPATVFSKRNVEHYNNLKKLQKFH